MRSCLKTDVRLVRRGWVNVTQGDVSVWVRGQAHLGDAYYDTKSLGTLFVDRSDSVVALDELVSRLNGCWAAVVCCEKWAYLATDHLRSIQILYRIEDGRFHVFDDMEDFRKAHRLEFDEGCVHEYLSSGYVYGSRTLFKGTYSLQAAERVWVGDDCRVGNTDATNSRAEHVEPVEEGEKRFSPTASRKVCKKYDGMTVEAWRYWRYVPNIKKPITTDDALVKRIDETFLTATRRLVESVGDRRVVVPLSGGYDSRLIVNYLYKLGVRNVLCYTYGVKGNGESRCSKEVASRLGYEWHYVEYTNENRTALLNDPSTNACFRYMCNGTNRYCNQEHIAIKELKDAGVLNTETDVIVPGYYFDYLAGSKVNLKAGNWLAASEMCQWENNFFPHKHFRKSIKAIRLIFNEHDDLGPKVYYEGWAWQERLAKFIINNVRDFEWLGFDWRLPLCDRDLFDVWLSLPCTVRYGRKYFREVFPRFAVGAIRDVSFNETAKISSLRKVKRWIGERIPYAVRFALRKILYRTVKNGSSTLADANVDVPSLARQVSEAFPFLRDRLKDLSGASPNAVIALKGLCAETAAC